MIESIYLLILLTCATGVLSGFLAGMFGIGGGIVVVPALYFLFQYLGASGQTATAMAVATSLMCIIPTSLSSLRSHYKLGNLDGPHLLRWSPALVLGALSGVLLLYQVDDWWLRFMFSLLVVFVALTLIFRTMTSGMGRTTDEASAWPAVRKVLIYPVVYGIACLSSMAGVGGGALGGPLLIAWGYSAHRAIGTAGGFGLLISAPAVALILISGETRVDAPALSYSLINFPAFFAIAVCSVMAAPMGAKIGKRLSSRLLGISLALLLLLIGIKMGLSLLAP